MKRIIPVAVLAALLLAGCAGPSGPAGRPVGWGEDWALVGDLLGVEPMEGFVPGENKDALGAAGLYYATWTAGEGEPITNDEGGEAAVYDAQLYVPIQQYKETEKAETALEDWQERERDNYEAGEAVTETHAGQAFTVLPLLEGNEGNPYTHGAAAFALHEGGWALCVELLCRDGFAGDPQALLGAFLDGFHYNDG